MKDNMLATISQIQHIQIHSIRRLVALCLFCVCLLWIHGAFAKSYTFSWTANLSPVIGYKLYYKKGGTAGPPFDGKDATEGPSPIIVGNVTTFTVTGLAPDTTYYFALKAYDSTEESDFSPIITVFPNETTQENVTAVINSDLQEGQAPLSVNFDATSSTGTIETYSWTFGDGTSASGPTVAHTYSTSGIFTTTLSVLGSKGLTSQASMTINVSTATPPQTYPPPTADISTSGSMGEVPLTVDFDGSGSTTQQPPLISYDWSFGDGSTGSGATISHTYTTTGVYTATLTVIDNANQTGQLSIPVVVTAVSSITNQPPSSVILTSQPTVGTAPFTITFDGTSSTDSDGSIASYIWNFGDGTTAIGSIAQHTYTDLGNYTVTLTVVDDEASTGESSVAVSIVTAEEFQQILDNKRNAAISTAINILLLNGK